jgi:hypothetical protein
VNLWIPDEVGHDAIGQPPERVALGAIPSDGAIPAAKRRAFALVGAQVRRYLRGEPPAKVVEHGH